MSLSSEKHNSETKGAWKPTPYNQMTRIMTRIFIDFALAAISRYKIEMMTLNGNSNSNFEFTERGAGNAGYQNNFQQIHMVIKN